MSAPLHAQLRDANEALTRAERQTERGNAQRRFTAEQVAQAKATLLQVARRYAAIAADIATGPRAAALPGLPSSQPGLSGAAMDRARAALAVVWNALGELETLRGDVDAGAVAFRNTLALAPGDVQAHAQLAELLEARHDTAAAKAHAECALRGDRHNVIAAIALARCLLREEKFAEAEVAALGASKAPRASADEYALAWMLAGEARERQGDTRGAFQAFTRGNQLMRQRYGETQQSSHPAHPDNVRALTSFLDRSSASTWRAPSQDFATPAPAFLVGFPRSGTTLIEQALSSHSDIVCLGETDHLFAALSVVLKDGDLLQRASTLRALEIEVVRAAFQRLVLADHPEAQGRLIVDKHPLHITILPIIHKMFPDAKIIFCERDPRDVVLSCYQQCFGANVATAQFWNLRSAAGYYDAVMSLMAACREKLRLDLHEIRYRDVVANFEPEMRGLTAFLGLPFEPAMLRYAETARHGAVSSASARQVIRPIYATSIARWRRYAGELAPVLPLLDGWARRLGYDV